MKRPVVLFFIFVFFAIVGGLVSGPWYQDSVIITGYDGLLLTGDATQYEDVTVPLGSLKPGGGIAAPGWAAYASGPVELETYWFDPATDECLDFALQVPHAAKEGQDVYECHVHWVPRITSDGNPANQKVDWYLDYVLQDPGDVVPVLATVTGNVHAPADADVVANKHYITDLSNIVAVNYGISAMLVGRICRDANDAVNDTYEQDAGILAFDCHMEMDALGSREEYLK